MYGSLFWIEWLDRLHRVLKSTRQDVATLTRTVNPRSLEAIERSKRQLAALTNDLRLLDRNVLAVATDNLQLALDHTLLQLADLADVLPQSAPAVRDRVLAAIDSALRDSSYEAAMLLAPGRRRAIAPAPDARV
jgi:hypothetical protein